jgi:hypothetical protein
MGRSSLGSDKPVHNAGLSASYGTVQIRRWFGGVAFVMHEQQPPKPDAVTGQVPAAQAPERSQSEPKDSGLPPIHPPSSNPLPPPLFQATSLPPVNPDPGRTPQRIPGWLHQAEFYLRLVVRMYLGVVTLFVPWLAPAWDANPLFSQPLWLHTFITYGAVRGLVSGLGLLNLWVALRDILHPPQNPPQPPR